MICTIISKLFIDIFIFDDIIKILASSKRNRPASARIRATWLLPDCLAVRSRFDLRTKRPSSSTAHISFITSSCHGSKGLLIFLASSATSPPRVLPVQNGLCSRGFKSPYSRGLASVVVMAETALSALTWGCLGRYLRSAGRKKS